MGTAMNSEPTIAPQDDWLEQALRAHGDAHRGDYIADAGFSARVMAALPAPVEAVPRWRRPAVVAIWAAAVAGASVALPDVALSVGREAFRLLAAQPVSLPQIGAALAALGIATWAAAGWALRSD